MKRVMAVVLTGLMLFAMCSCGATEFDAKSYVHAVLDAKFHREYGKYADFVGIKKEEAKEQMETEFEQSLKSSMEAELAKLNLKASEEEMQKYLQLEADVRSKVQCTIKDVVKGDKGNYSVEVEIVPVLVYEGWSADVNEQLTAAVQKGANSDEYMSIILECFKKHVEKAESGDKESFTFHLICNDSGDKMVYSISEEEILNVELLATGQKTK